MKNPILKKATFQRLLFFIYFLLISYLPH
ncbi:MAG: hypothetical protein RL662_1341, partial [Bacteroidota bacterium]